MKDKLDILFKTIFDIKKVSVKTPEIPGKIIPESGSSRRLGFSVIFIVIIIFCFISFTLYASFKSGYEVPLTIVCNNFIETYKLNEKLVEGISFLHNIFIKYHL